MRPVYKTILLVCAGSLISLPAIGQDSQTLGDAARQARQQKQTKPAEPAGKDGQPKKARKVITNEEIPAHLVPVKKSSAANQDAVGAVPEPSQDAEKGSAEEWKSKIEEQRSEIRSLQSQVDQLSESIHFAPANCVSNCVQWNERQRDKQQQVDQMKSQLEEQKKRLDELQEEARKLGFGSSVYDP